MASTEKGVSGFKTTGIYPLNQRIFSKQDFMAADALLQTEAVEECQQDSSYISSIRLSTPVAEHDMILNNTNEALSDPPNEAVVMPSTNTANVKLFFIANSKDITIEYT